MSYPQRQVGRQFEETAYVDKLEVGVPQCSVGIRAGDTDVVIDPEGDTVAKVAGGKNAEEAGLKIRGRNVSAHGAGRKLRIEIICVPTGYLEELVVTQADRRDTGMVPGQTVLGHNSFWAGAPSITGGILINDSSSLGNLKPASLNAFPKSFSLGKSTWQVEQEFRIAGRTRE